MSKVFEIDNFLTLDECNSLINYQRKHSANDIDKWSLENHDSNWNNRIVILNKFDDHSIKKLVELVHYKISILCAKSYNENYVYPEFSNLVYWAPGMQLGIHADNMWIDDPEKPHYTSHRDFSAVIYLNDNYEGGRTFFCDGYEAKPKTGKKAAAKLQRAFDLIPNEDFELPPHDLLEAPPVGTETNKINKDSLEQNARFLESVLDDFGVHGEITKVRPGPVVTLYELEPAPGTKTSRVIGLSDDIARSMSAISVRVAVVPGRNVIGIELPNIDKEMVFLRELLTSDPFERASGKLNVALGKDIGG